MSRELLTRRFHSPFATRILFSCLALVFILPMGCGDDKKEEPPDKQGEIWVANRAAGSVSVIDIASDTVLATIVMPDNGEPMYVNYADPDRQVLVGDRANDRVMVFNADTRELASTVAAGVGVFHQWVSADFSRFYVNNDVDKTTSVINARSLQSTGEIPMPTDLAALGGKPHDVFVDPAGDVLFVSYLGLEGDHDYVVRFDASTLDETHRAQVGKDPHLFASAKNAFLYVPCQNSNQVVVLKRSDLSSIKVLDVPGAHGVIINPAGTAVYVTNLTGGGENAVYTIKTADNTLASSSGEAAGQVGSPHNLAINADGSKLYLTHSGDSSIVSVFSIDPQTLLPSFLSEVTVGENPFGLGFVPKSALAETKEYNKVAFNVSSLSTLRDGHHYEGWAIFDGSPVSTGKFNVDASGVATDLDGIAIPDGEFDAGRDLSIASTLVITIEIPGDEDIVPNESHYLAGDINGTSAVLSVSHPDALGDNFTEATGSYILATPTDGAQSNETSGVWFLSLQMADPAPGLSLPVLPAGWSYEGWAVIDGQPVTTGKFLTASGADDAAPFSGTQESGPPFPGEDFLLQAPNGLSFPTDLSESKIVISIEPVPDDSTDPFLLKPLAGDVPSSAADHQTFDLTNVASDFPVITASLRE